MKKLMLFLAFAGIGLGSSGCFPQVSEFVLYGPCEDMAFYAMNGTPHYIEVAVENEVLGPIAPGDEVVFSKRFAAFQNLNKGFALRASVVPFNPNIRSATDEWRFTNNGNRYFRSSGSTPRVAKNAVVRAVVELTSTNPKARTNQLRFRF